MGGASGRILQVAAERFAENGYRGTSIEEIAAGAEISRRSLFWHFGSKEGLLRAVIEDTLGAWTETMAEAGDEQRGLAGLRAAVGAMTGLHKENPSMVRLLALLLGEASATEPALVPVFVEIERSVLKLWRGFLVQAAEDGELRPGVNPDQAAAVINAAAFGARQLWALNPEDHPVGTTEAALLHVIDCLSADGPPVRRRSAKPRAKAGAR
jgi:AcrR family transcriptional regulator